MELDILNDILTNTVGDLFRAPQKYNIFSPFVRPQVVLNNPTTAITCIKTSVMKQQSQPSQNTSFDQIQNNIQLKNVQQSISQQRGQPIQQLKSTLGTQSLNQPSENKKILSSSLNSSIQSLILDQSINSQLNTSKESIPRNGNISSLNSSINSSKNSLQGSGSQGGQQTTAATSTGTSTATSSATSTSTTTATITTTASSKGSGAQGKIGTGTDPLTQQQQAMIFSDSTNLVRSSSNQLNQTPGNSSLANPLKPLIQNGVNSQQILNNGQVNNTNLKKREPQVNNFTKKEVGQTLISPEDWIRLEAKKRLDESMKRLGIDKQKISMGLIKEMSLEQLQIEKKCVKNELKNYDQAFENYFNVQPTRVQKEPMRPLYVFYKGLKQALSNFPNNGLNINNSNTNKENNNILKPQRNAINGNGCPQILKNSPSTNTTLNQSTSQQNSVQLVMNSSHQSSHNDSFDVHNHSNSYYPQTLNSSYSQNTQPLKPNMNPTSSSMNNLNTNIGQNPRVLQVSNQQQQQSQQSLKQQQKQQQQQKEPIQQYQKRSSSESSRDFRKNQEVIDQTLYKDIMNIVQEQKENYNHFKQSPNNNYNNNGSSNVNNNGSSNESQKVVEQKINQIKRRRAALRDQLQVYQNDFYLTHNRKIKYHKDILPVEAEYKEYKDIKREIIQLEQLVQPQLLHLRD